MTSTPEYWFTIGREPNENGYGLHPYLTAHVRAAEPASIYDQLMAVHREEPAAQDALTIQKRIKIQTSDYTEMTCPDLKDQLRKLKSLPIRLPEIYGDYVIIHPMIHAFLIDGQWGCTDVFDRRQQPPSSMGARNASCTRRMPQDPRSADGPMSDMAATALIEFFST